MTVGIDIRVLGNKIKSGVEEYTENLLAHLLPLDGSIKFKLFFSSFRGTLNDYDWLHLKNVELFQFKIPNRILFLSSGLTDLPKTDKLISGADVFFSPHFFITSLSPQCRRVTTFHDLSYVHFPEYFSWRKNIWHNFEMNPLWQSRFSDKVIAVSESTARDLINIYGIDPVKIEVIHSGISPDIRRPSADEIKRFKIRNKLPDKFILFLGKLEPRKNVVGIIRAFNILKNRREFNDLNLVIVGSKGWLYEDIFKEINKSNFKKQIVVKGHIDDNQRKFYYSAAEVFVYPSFFEGFGFPPLEAMACGTPTVVSNVSSFPEIVGNGGILVQPDNVNDIAGSISRILTDRELKDRLIDLGTKKISKFNWQKTASKTLECISSNTYKT